MTISDTTITSVTTLQMALSVINMLALEDYKYPTGITVADGSEYDFIIIGSGPGGSVLANRLTEDLNNDVLLIEAGGIPPLESSYAGLFTLQPNSNCDWNISSYDDGEANQYLQNNKVEMTTGRMLGGSSSLNHLIHVPPTVDDCDRWVALTGDDSYKHDYFFEYIKKLEELVDEEIMAEHPTYHGTSGLIKVKREPSEKNKNILKAFEEIGHKNILDINANNSLGYTEPLVTNGDMWRQSAAETYLANAKDRPNLFVQLNALATKIIIDDSNVATGVQILTSDGTYKTIKARKEVIVSGGAIKSAQLLMLSGIGPKSHLEELRIKVIADLPVGDNLLDHIGVVLGYTLEESDEVATSIPTKFPVPMTNGYVSLNGTKYPDYQSINLLFPHDSSGLLQLCVWVFKYKNKICEALYNANKGKDMMFSVINLMRPKSTGTIRLKSTDPTDNPKVYLGHLSDPTDLDLLAKSLKNYNSILESSHFKKINSTMVDYDLTECKGLDRNSFDFWKCYAKCMSSTMWHYSSTCAIGKVLDNTMTVKGVENLRVVDASTMPSTISGNINSAIYALAEKAADIIKAKWSSC